MEKSWLEFYEPHVPEHIDYPEITMPAILEETARKYPGHTATIFKDAKLTFREINEAVDRFAAALQGLGVKKGDRVAIHLLNMPQFPIAYYAVLRIGGIVVPCNPLYTAREMRHQVSDSGAKVIVTLSMMYPIIKQIRAETKLEHVVVAKIKTYFPPVLNLLFTLLKEKKGGHRVDISGDANTYWFKDVLDNAPAKPAPVEIDMQDTAVFMYTGGTTGVSKGAQLTHKNILANAYQCKVWINAEQGRGDVSVTALPLYHSYAMTTCMNMSTIIAGGMLLIPDPRDLEDVLKSITKHQPAFYAGVPAMYVAINNYPNLEKYDVGSIRACISGAAGLPVEVQQRFQEITGARLVEGYGLSEASPVTHANPIFGDNRVGTIGVPWPDTEVKIVDADTGEKELGVGEAGELCIRGPQVMKGYWQMPTETANSLRGHGGGGPWLHTGDVAVMDDDGYFKIVDRKKDMILGAGGYNIYPREVEDALYEHPAVMEVAAAGIPVPGKGERVKVYIVLKEGQTATEEEIIAFCKENLAPYKVPKFVQFRDELPKTMVGKILRRVLVEEEKKKLAE